MNFRIGDKVLSYEVLDVLGAGGMGEVYKVRNQISDRVEALKVLLADLQAQPDLGDRFLREIKVQARLNHPNIAGLHAAFEFQGKLVMILEMVEGTTISQRLRAGRMSLKEAIDCAAQALAALDYAHRLGVTHRDVKPANMMVTSDGTVKLMDFGIAKAATERTLTRTGGLMGTLYYMSPEQIRGDKQIDGRTDIYSLGVVLYEMVTGKKPFGGSSEYSIMRAHLEEPAVPPVRCAPLVPLGLNDVILRALAKRREDRFQTAAEFREALMPDAPPAAFRAAAADPAGPIRTESVPRTPEPPSAFAEEFNASLLGAPRSKTGGAQTTRPADPPEGSLPVEPVTLPDPRRDVWPGQRAQTPGQASLAQPPRGASAAVAGSAASDEYGSPATATRAVRRSRLGVYMAVAAGLILAVAAGFLAPRWMSEDGGGGAVLEALIPPPFLTAPPEGGSRSPSEPANEARNEVAGVRAEKSPDQRPASRETPAPPDPQPMAAATASPNSQPQPVEQSPASSNPGRQSRIGPETAPAPGSQKAPQTQLEQTAIPRRGGSSSQGENLRNQVAASSTSPPETKTDASAPSSSAPRQTASTAGTSPTTPAADSSSTVPPAASQTPSPSSEPHISPDHVFEIGEVDIRPQLIHQVRPKYTPSTPNARVSGRVRLSAEIWVDGSPHNIEVAESIGDKALDQSAVEAFAQWRFAPGRKSGQAVKTRVTADLRFQVL